MLGFISVVFVIGLIIFEQYSIHSPNSKANKAVRNHTEQRILETKQDILKNMNSENPSIANMYKFAYVTKYGNLGFDQDKKPNTNDWIEQRDSVL